MSWVRGCGAFTRNPNAELTLSWCKMGCHGHKVVYLHEQRRNEAGTVLWDSWGSEGTQPGLWGHA